MAWIDTCRLAEIHREVYAAILRSWVPHGEREEFARKCGITREYLSCLCATDDQEGNVPIHKRYPSLKTTKRIAQNLPAAEEIRRSLFEVMELAHENAAQTFFKPGTPVEPGEMLDRLDAIGQAHQEATFGVKSADVNRAYRLVRNASRMMLHLINPKEHPDSYAKACLYYHNAQCVLNRPDEALRFAKIGQEVMECYEEIEPGYTRVERDNLIMNTIRGEVVAYHNLKLDRKVPVILAERASGTSAFRNAQEFWEPIIDRDLIISLVAIPRFHFREANEAARRAKTICEHTGDELMLLLTHEAWLRSLIAHERWKQANRIFDEEMGFLPHMSNIGALHKVLVLKGGALLAWKQHDLEAWKLYITKTVQIAHQAGLNHQMETIQRYYGSAVETICSELGFKVKGIR